MLHVQPRRSAGTAKDAVIWMAMHNQLRVKVISKMKLFATIAVFICVATAELTPLTPLSRSEPLANSGLVCSLCETSVKVVNTSLVIGGLGVDTVTGLVTAGCKLFGGSLVQAQCNFIVDNIQEIAYNIRQGFNALQICESLHLCSEVSQPKPHLPAVDFHDVMEDMKKTLEDSGKAVKGVICSVCVSTVKLANMTLSLADVDSEKLVSVVESGCKKLAGTFLETECLYIVENIAVVEYYHKEATAVEVCEQLTLCATAEESIGAEEVMSSDVVSDVLASVLSQEYQ